MPLYEYQCNDCGEEFERMVRFSEADQLPDCPACRGADTRRKLSVFATLGSLLFGSSSGSSCGSSGPFT